MNNLDAPTGEQINRAIHEWMGGHWHTFTERAITHINEDGNASPSTIFECACNDMSGYRLETLESKNPQYTESLDAVHEAEKCLVKEWGTYNMRAALVDVVIAECPDNVPPNVDQIIWLANADQRARAIYSLIKSAQQEKKK